MTAASPTDATAEASECLKSRQPFLLYRPAGATQPRFHPFDQGTNTYHDAVVEPFDRGHDLPTDVDAVPPATKKADYLHGFKALKTAMEQGQLKKAVLSRVITVDRVADFSSLAFFLRLARAYPQAMVYLARHPRYGLWVGATPEVLLRKAEGWWHTVSLAGTRPHNPGGRYHWGHKERDEQEWVSQHIRRVLKQIAARDVVETGPRTAAAGSVAHLKTDFRFRLDDESSTVPRLLAALHPTPAVGGWPTASAGEIINRAEGHERQLYTGYLGRMEPAGGVELYVNLRCMKIGERQLALFCGGGITPGSVAEAEWDETRDKAKTLLRHLPADPH